MESIGILGAGNSGLALSAHLSKIGYKVHLWNRSEQNIQTIKKGKSISTIGEIKGQFPIYEVTSNIEKVVKENKILIVTTPAFAHKKIAQLLKKHITKEHKILLTPGRTFGCLEFEDILIKEGAEIPKIFETETIIHTCRKINDSTVDIITIKDKVKIFSNKHNPKLFLNEFNELFKCYFDTVDNYLEGTLSNVGPLLHVAPVIFNYTRIEYTEEFLHYTYAISPKVASYIDKIEKERIKIARSLNINIETIYQWFSRCYNINETTTYDCVNKNPYYKTIVAPKDINHRYIHEDIPYGLVPIESIANYKKIEVKAITGLIDVASELYNTDFREVGRKYHNLKKYL